MMLRSMLAVLVFCATAAVAQQDPMFASDGTLAERVALENGISDVCASALLQVENQAVTSTLVSHVDHACHEEVEDAIMGRRVIEFAPHAALLYLNNMTLFLDVEDGEPVVTDVSPGRFNLVTWE